jgi:hypothetical protein
MRGSSGVSIKARLQDLQAYTTEGTSKRSAAEEQRDTILALIALIPHAQIIHHAWKQSGFGNSEAVICQLSSTYLCLPPSDHSQESHSEEAWKILRNAHQRRNQTPYQSQRRQPELGRRPLEDDVAWNFEEDVTDKVECQASKVLISCHLEVGC